MLAPDQTARQKIYKTRHDAHSPSPLNRTIDGPSHHDRIKEYQHKVAQLMEFNEQILFNNQELVNTNKVLFGQLTQQQDYVATLERENALLKEDMLNAQRVQSIHDRLQSVDSALDDLPCDPRSQRHLLALLDIIRRKLSPS